MPRMPLFVYGALQRHHRLHLYLKDAQFVDEATIKGFQMFALTSYPALVMGDGEVHGELYLAPAKTIEVLDMIEGVAWGHYVRASCRPVLHANGVTVDAEVYLWGSKTPEGVEFIKDGIWRG